MPRIPITTAAVPRVREKKFTGLSLSDSDKRVIHRILTAPCGPYNQRGPSSDYYTLYNLSGRRYSILSLGRQSK